uniref:Uncharacterized protein n=1 Tax=Aegilops tauschii subsp. strangulata TaxID=200361 RepID=A0A453S9W5_AEGTS
MLHNKNWGICDTILVTFAVTWPHGCALLFSVCDFVWIILGVLRGPRRHAPGCWRPSQRRGARWHCAGTRGRPTSCCSTDFCFPAVERLDLSLAWLLGHPLLSSASRAAGPLASSFSNDLSLHPEEIAEQNAFVAACLAAYLPTVSDTLTSPSTAMTPRRSPASRPASGPRSAASTSSVARISSRCSRPAPRSPRSTAAARLTDLGLASAFNGFHFAELGAIAAVPAASGGHGVL